MSTATAVHLERSGTDQGRRPAVFVPPLPIAAALVPNILRARGVEVSRKRFFGALHAGAIPAKREQWRWILTPEHVDAAESYFRSVAALGSAKGGTGAVRRAKTIGRLSDAQSTAGTK